MLPPAGGRRRRRRRGRGGHGVGHGEDGSLLDEGLGGRDERVPQHKLTRVKVDEVTVDTLVGRGNAHAYETRAVAEIQRCPFARFTRESYEFKLFKKKKKKNQLTVDTPVKCGNAHAYKTRMVAEIQRCQFARFTHESYGFSLF